jgi:hypothetical protein
MGQAPASDVFESRNGYFAAWLPRRDARWAFGAPWENWHAMAPLFFDPHVCSPPPTEGLVGQEMDFRITAHEYETVLAVRAERLPSAG